MKIEKVRQWLYLTQQRLAITHSEATLLIVLATLLAGGMVARYLQSQPRAVPGSPFAATDHRFQQGAARLRSRSARPDSSVDAPPEPAEDGDARPPRAASGQGRVDLNEASSAELERLPGVGPVIAGRIAAYRERHGPFAEVGHLRRVRGIGPKTMNDLAPMLRVQPAADSAAGATP